jgi:hypothetical protein
MITVLRDPPYARYEIDKMKAKTTTIANAARQIPMKRSSRAVRS